METMESGQDKKAGAHDAGGVEPEALIVKFGPLKGLIRQKCGAQQNRKQEEAFAPLASLNQSTLRKVKGEAARYKTDGCHDRFDHRFDILQRLRHLPTSPSASSQHHVTPDKPGEEHRFRREER